MISLKDNRTALLNIPVTIAALEQIDLLIERYTENRPGPAYVTFEHVDGPGTVRAQIDRKIILPALQAQRATLVAYLKTLGIEA